MAIGVVALGAVGAGLVFEVWRDDRVALDRERRLVQAAASLVRTTAEMEQIATHDQLTGLVTRRAGFERLGMEFQRVVRYGGEEFLVILPEPSEADAVAVAEKLRNAVSA